MPAMTIAAMAGLSIMYTLSMFAGSLGGAAGAAAGTVSKGLSKGKNTVAGVVGIGGTGGSGPTPASKTGVVASTVPMEGGSTDSQSDSSVADNTAQDLSATSVTESGQATLEQYEDGTTPDAPANQTSDSDGYQEPSEQSLSELDDREAFEAAVSDDWSDEQVDDLWELNSKHEDGSVGQSLAAEALKSVVGKELGALIGGAVGGIPGALMGGAAGWATQKSVERYGDGISKRLPDDVRTRFADTVDTVTTKADMWASDIKMGWDVGTGRYQSSDHSGGAGGGVESVDNTHDKYS
ncbi:hypothetical protein [Haloarcula sp. CBA1127]|uniref:hypothetical protein n=1 Tax=Haloarcula sp. CBA1127 TaxID=1765055 RepID=UPI000AAE2D25|nr:hypothetical protein [Haloarcula sp. CBA1127]